MKKMLRNKIPTIVPFRNRSNLDVTQYLDYALLACEIMVDEIWDLVYEYVVGFHRTRFKFEFERRGAFWTSLVLKHLHVPRIHQKFIRQKVILENCSFPCLSRAAQFLFAFGLDAKRKLSTRHSWTFRRDDQKRDRYISGLPQEYMLLQCKDLMFFQVCRWVASEEGLLNYRTSFLGNDLSTFEYLSKELWVVVKDYLGIDEIVRIFEKGLLNLVSSVLS